LARWLTKDSMLWDVDILGGRILGGWENHLGSQVSKNNNNKHVKFYLFLNQAWLSCGANFENF
jgi:hypothetical protein